MVGGDGALTIRLGIDIREGAFAADLVDIT
jgi:hypothetical protein